MSKPKLKCGHLTVKSTKGEYRYTNVKDMLLEGGFVVIVFGDKKQAYHNRDNVIYMKAEDIYE